MTCRAPITKLMRKAEIKRRESHTREAMLCAILGVIKETGQLDKVMARVQARVADTGVTARQIMDWHDEHERKDATRRAYEARLARRQQVVAEALDMPTDEQKEALSLQGTRNPFR